MPDPSATPSWTQDDVELSVEFCVPANTARRDVSCKIGVTKLFISVGGDTLFDDTFCAKCVVDESHWALEGSGETRKLVVTITKLKLGHQWPFLAGGDADDDLTESEEEAEQHPAAQHSERLMFLYHAAETGDCEALACVLSAGGVGDINKLVRSRSRVGRVVASVVAEPALHGAVRNNHHDAAKLLLDHGAAPHIANAAGQTALQGAAELGHLQLLRLLLDQQADPNLTDQCGSTPIHRAAFTGKLDCVKLLVNAGCNTTQHWKQIGTAWDAAVRGNQKVVQDFLRESGDPAYVLAQADSACDQGDWRRALAGYKTVKDCPRAHEQEGRMLFQLGFGILQTQLPPAVSEQQFRQEQLGEATDFLEQAVTLLKGKEVARPAAAWLLTAKFMSSWQSAKSHIDCSNTTGATESWKECATLEHKFRALNFGADGEASGGSTGPSVDFGAGQYLEDEDLSVLEADAAQSLLALARAQILFKLASLACCMNKWDEARRCYVELLEIRPRALVNRSGVLRHLTFAEVMMERYPVALERFNERLLLMANSDQEPQSPGSVCHFEESHDVLLTDLNMICTEHEKNPHPCGEIPEYEKQLKDARSNGGWKYVCTFLQILAHANEVRGNVAQSIKNYTEAAKLAEDNGDATTHGDVLSRRGSACICIGQWQQAIDSFQRAVEIAQEARDRYKEAFRQSRLGMAQSHMGKAHTCEAESNLEQARKIARNEKNMPVEIDCFNALGNLYHTRGADDQALEMDKEALRVAESTEDAQRQAKCLVQLAHQFTVLRRFVEAKEHGEKALSLVFDDDCVKANALDSIGSAEAELHNYDEADRRLTQALLLYKRAPPEDTGQRIRAQMTRGRVQRLLLKYPEADVDLAQALEHAQSHYDRSIEADVLVEFAKLYCAQQEHKQAQQCAEKALKLARHAEDLDVESLALDVLSEAHYNQRHYQIAVDHAKSALQLIRSRRKTAHSRFEAEALNRLADALMRQGNHTQGSCCYTEALELSRENGDSDGEMMALGKLGTVQKMAGNYSDAVKYQEQALKVREASRPLGDWRGPQALEIRDGLICCLGELASIHGIFLNQREKQINYLERALELARSDPPDPKRERELLLQLGTEPPASDFEKGERCIELGQLEEAFRYFQAELTRCSSPEVRDRRMEGRCKLNLAVCIDKRFNQLLNDVRTLPEHLSQEETVRVELAASTTGQAHLVLPARFDVVLMRFNLVMIPCAMAVIRLTEEALVIARELNDPDLQAQALEYIGLIQMRIACLGRASINDGTLRGIKTSSGMVMSRLIKEDALAWAEQAEERLRETITVSASVRSRGLDDTQRIGIFQKQYRPHDRLVTLLVFNERFEDALVAAEECRALSLARELSSDDQAEEKWTIQRTQRLAVQLKADLVYYHQTASSKQHELLIWHVSAAGGITFSAQVGGVPQFDGTVNAQLVALLAVFERCRGKRGIVERGGEFDASGGVDDDTTQKWSYALRQLHDLLIPPTISAKLKGATRVIFFPHSDLAMVPFGVLKDSGGERIMDAHVCHVGLSMRAMETSARLPVDDSTMDVLETTQASQPLIVGFPTESTSCMLPKITTKDGITRADGWIPHKAEALHDAIRECEAVAGMMACDALVGAAATKAEVVRRMPSANLIHLAVHGIVDGLGKPRLLLAPELEPEIEPEPEPESEEPELAADELTPPDQWLTPADISAIAGPFYAQLAVLSACNSGCGRVADGEGVVGHARALVAQGVKTVVVALWRLPDDVTSKLMQRFYATLSTGERVDVAEALNQAMKETRHDDATITERHWGSFNVIGAGSVRLVGCQRSVESVSGGASSDRLRCFDNDKGVLERLACEELGFVYKLDGNELAVGSGLELKSFHGRQRQILTQAAVQAIFGCSQYHMAWGSEGPIVRRAKDATREQREYVLVCLDNNINQRERRDRDDGHEHMLQAIKACAEAIRAMDTKVPVQEPRVAAAAPVTTNRFAALSVESSDDSSSEETDDESEEDHVQRCLVGFERKHASTTRGDGDGPAASRKREWTEDLEGLPVSETQQGQLRTAVQKEVKRRRGKQSGRLPCCDGRYRCKTPRAVSDGGQCTQCCGEGYAPDKLRTAFKQHVRALKKKGGGAVADYAVEGPFTTADGRWYFGNCAPHCPGGDNCIGILAEGVQYVLGMPVQANSVPDTSEVTGAVDDVVAVGPASETSTSVVHAPQNAVVVAVPVTAQPGDTGGFDDDDTELPDIDFGDVELPSMSQDADSLAGSPSAFGGVVSDLPQAY